jgi:hypothetical protein
VGAVNCKDVRELLNEYIENELSLVMRESVKAHIDSCDACKKELEELIALQNNLRAALKTAAGDVVPPAGSLAIIKERAGMASAPVKNGFWSRMSAPAGVALSLLMVFITLFSFVPFMFGASAPPPDAPPIVSDGIGGAFFVWSDGAHGQETIRVQHVDSQGNYLWERDGKEIASGNLGYLYAASDGGGGIVISWRNNNSTSLLRLDSSGHVVCMLEDFTSLKVQSILNDGFGNTFLLLYDYNNGIYVQKVGKEGVPLFGADGVHVYVSQDNYNKTSIISDEQGGAVVIWQEQKNQNVTIHAQRIDSCGELLWEEDGVIITSITNCYDANPQIVSDGTGSFIIAWDTGTSGIDTDVYVQKLDGEGNLLWGTRGIPVCGDQIVEYYPSINIQSNPRIAADGTGGAIVIWKDRREIGNGEIYAQRISADGDILWVENGVWLWNIPEEYPDTAGILDSDIISDGNGGAIVVWTGYESLVKNTIVYSQKIDRDGELLWSNDVVYNNPDIRLQGYSNVVGDGSGGVIIVSRAGEDNSLSNAHSIYAQHIDAEGNLLWEEGGLQIKKVSSSPVVLIISAIAIIIAGFVIYGLYRGNKVARGFVPISSLLLFFMGIYCVFLMTTTIGTNVFEWDYVLGTPINWVAIWCIIISGLVLAILGVKKTKITKWVTIPVFIPYVLWAVVAVIQGYWLIFGAI